MTVWAGLASLVNIEHTALTIYSTLRDCRFCAR
jgi:hypothetical protein